MPRINKYYYFYGVRLPASAVMKAIYGMEKPTEESHDAYHDLLGNIDKVLLEINDNVTYGDILSKHQLYRIPLDFHLVHEDEQHGNEEEVVVGICIAIVNYDHVNKMALTPGMAKESLNSLFLDEKIPKELGDLIKPDQLQYILITDAC